MNISTLPKITAALIGMSLYVALISRLGSDIEPLRPYFISWYVNSGLQEIRNGEIWRLVTPIFIHFGAMHIIFNLMMTWQLGEVLERRLGMVRYGIIVLFLAISSNLAQYYYDGPGFGGLSGVLYGLFGYFWIASRYYPNFGYQINPGAVKILLVWFALGWVDFFGLLGNLKVANMAHTGGLVAGMLLAYLDSLRVGRHYIKKR